LRILPAIQSDFHSGACLPFSYRRDNVYNGGHLTWHVVGAVGSIGASVAFVTGFVAQMGFGDSCCEFSVVADSHEQLDTNDLQDQELVILQSTPEAARFVVDLV
jgi:hypothetical protein